MNYILENYFEINKEGVQTIKFPLILFAIVLVVGWKECAILMIVGLFFNLEYTISGTNDHTQANTFFKKCSSFVQDIKKAI